LLWTDEQPIMKIGGWKIRVSMTIGVDHQRSADNLYFSYAFSSKSLKVSHTLIPLDRFRCWAYVVVTG